jgi:hypothetical protein
MRSSFKPWSREDIEMLEKLHKTMTTEEIGKAIGRTKNSVIGKLNRKDGYSPKAVQKNGGKDAQKTRFSLSRAKALVMPAIIPIEAPKGFKTLLEAGPKDCRWPDKKDKHIICGQETVHRCPYCAKHMSDAYQHTPKYRASGLDSLDRSIIRNLR